VPTLAVLGTMSDAGKSTIAAGICRVLRNGGIQPAPFKAQNMSNNARVVPGLDGEPGEIGSAQYFQALAAGVLPHVDMNPVLLKPERDTASQVVLHGRVQAGLSRQPWRERSAALADAARASFERLAQRHDLLLIEGAGSPAEINLAPQDYVNLGTARWARAIGRLQALLVADIDRGGAFAHLHGTWALLPDDLRPALAGFVLNKFRGDATLLAPGPAQLQALTGVPLLGVLPMRREHGLPEEDGIYRPPSSHRSGPRIGIVAWPRLSNLDEFQPLNSVARVSWVRSLADLDSADWIVLPGSKQVSGDLAWLRQQGLDTAIVQHARAGRPLLGICGGLQVLGQWLEDPDAIDGEAHGPIPGLGLLPLATRHAAPKRLRAGPVRFGTLAGPWAALSGLQPPAYEIRNGRTTATPAAASPAGLAASPVLFDATGQAIGWQAGPVLGLATHGLLEAAVVLQALFGAGSRTLDAVFDGLADLVDEHLGAATLRSLMQA